MGIVERKQRQKSEVRAGILQAAWQMVTEDGWQSLSIRRLADAIEYSVPVIYDHFENKEAILMEFTRQGFRLLGDKLLEIQQQPLSTEQQLEAFAFAYWDFAFHNKAYYQVMFGLGMPGCERVRSMPELQAFTELMQQAIKRLMEENGIEHADPFLKFQSCWSMLHGMVSINISTPADVPSGMHKEEMNRLILNDLVSAFIKGIRA